VLSTVLADALANATIPYSPHFRSEVVLHGWVPQGIANWPPNDGFARTPVQVILQPGTLIDQFSTPYGNFFFAAGTPYRKRSYPYICDELFYNMYRVLVPTPVLMGKMAPWFEEPGGGVQYKAYVSGDTLLRDAKIELVVGLFPGFKSPSKPCD